MSLDTNDHLEILQLYARYNTAIDTGDGKSFGECWVEDGHFDTGASVTEGRPAIAEFANQTHAAMPGMRHNATNIVIEGGGDRARGSAFLIGYDVSGGYKVIVTGRYADELVRTGEGWQFTRRVFRADG